MFFTFCFLYMYIVYIYREDHILVPLYVSTTDISCGNICEVEHIYPDDIPPGYTYTDTYISTYTNMPGNHICKSEHIPGIYIYEYVDRCLGNISINSHM